ncbi:MAG: YebC/PmpR family DNA-binding transcriptional regulator [Eubacteriales bacterium]|nr:YebC/PmpR family DNA-binding transcriptional regulator [Eubacteriales bacterium]
MSGHSKWSTIKRKKEKTDAQRGKIFTKISRDIIVAVRESGPDPETNSKLRDAIAKAKASNLPNDNIKRSILKGSGDAGGASYEEITYEGYGPSGVAVMVEAMTDNKNRTAADMRHYFDKNGGNLGQTGSVGFMFDKKGIMVIERNASLDEDTVMMDALDAGATDFAAEEDYFEIVTDPNDFSAVYDVLDKKGYEFAQAEVQYVPQTTVALTDEKDIFNMNRLVDMLEDNDDVQNVWHNWEE